MPMGNHSRSSWIAPSDTLLGRLQRGTGAGYLDAIAADGDAARAALKSAIRLDVRWDTQLDSRGWYYACLAAHLGLSAEDVETLILSTRDWDSLDAIEQNAVYVLGQFASWGDRRAAKKLVEYVQYGRCPDIAMGWCAAEGELDDLDSLYRALSARIPDAAALLRDAAFRDRGLLRHRLNSLAERDGRFRRFVRFSAAAQEDHPADEYPLPATLFDSGMTFEQGCRAFLEMPLKGKRNHDEIRNWLNDAVSPSHARWLEEFLITNDSCITSRLGDLAALLPVDAWPTFTLRALADGRPGPRWAASGLLERSESPSADLVRWCLAASLEADDMYPVCDMLDLVRQSRLVDLVPDIEVAYAKATYSHGARTRAVDTLVCLVPCLFRERYARECLWDCEEQIMEAGCRHVDLDDCDVRLRLEFLRDAFDHDADEEPAGVYRAACERLDS